MNDTIIGVDLAKHVLQICVVKSNKVVSNKEINASEFSVWLVKTDNAIIHDNILGDSPRIASLSQSFRPRTSCIS